MKNSYLVYLGWTALGVLAVIALGVHEHLRPDPNEKFGNPVVFIGFIFFPSILLGWLAGLGLTALFHHLHPAVAGTLAYGGAIIATAGLAILQQKIFL
jgi:peptidoglycan/LPS O-acetylase OafA/YrhL